MSLGRAQGLTYLTLFSNPICQVRQYRTIVARSCESLRGLDYYAVSDEEAIQGSRFFDGSRYRACSPAVAIPQALVVGFTELLSTPLERKHRQAQAQHGLRWSDCTHTVGRLPIGASAVEGRDILAKLHLRVRLLRRFHAHHSPVIICQGAMRRFLRYQTSSAAAVRIQASARMWFVLRRAREELVELLRQTDELYLIEVR